MKSRWLTFVLVLLLPLAVGARPPRGAGKLSLDIQGASSRLAERLSSYFDVPTGVVKLYRKGMLWVKFPGRVDLKAGSVLVVYQPGKPIVDPDTGQRFPGIDVPVGYAQAVEKKGELVIFRFLKGEGVPMKGFLVRYPETVKLYVDCSRLSQEDVCQQIKVSLMEMPRFSILNSPAADAYVVKPVLIKEPSGRVRLALSLVPPATSGAVASFVEKVRSVRAVSTAMLLQGGGESSKWAKYQGLIATRVFASKFMVIGAGDIDGDGKSEVVLAGDGAVKAFRIKGKSFEKVASFSLGKRGGFYRFLHLDLLDLDGDGRPEIYVSAVFQDTMEGVYKAYPASFVLVYRDGKLEKVADLKYLLRAVKLDEFGGEILLGQKIGEYQPFKGPIVRIVYKNGSYQIDKALPGYIRKNECLYGWAVGDLTGDGKKEMALIDGDILVVSTVNGTEIWESAEPLGPFTHLYFYQTPRFFTPPAMKNFQPEEVAKKRVLPRRINVVYFPSENRNAVLTVANDEKRFIIAGIKIAGDYEGMNGRVVKIEKVSEGTFYSAYFDAVWETPKYSGIYGEDFAIGDFDGDGVLDLAFLGYLRKSGKTRIDIYKLPGM